MSSLSPTTPVEAASRTRFGDTPSSPKLQTPVPAVPPSALFPNDPAHVEPLRLRRAPLLFAAVCFALGELLAVWRPHPPALLLLAELLLLCLAVLALSRAARHADRASGQWAVTLPVAALWIVAGVLAAHLRPAPDPQSALIPYADYLSRTVVGRVLRVHPLPPRPAAETADSEHSWQPAEIEDEAPQAEQVDLQLSEIE